MPYIGAFIIKIKKNAIRMSPEFPQKIKDQLLRIHALPTSAHPFWIEQGVIHIGKAEELNSEQHHQLQQLILDLKPWKKGPYTLFSHLIDADWRCEMKWNRLSPILPLLSGKRLLDIGSNSGYFLFRMAEHHPEEIVGLESKLAYYAQYMLVNHCKQKNPNIQYLPINSSQYSKKNYFDIVFDMGVLYHQKSPIDHLLAIRSFLKKKGTLILETLMIDGDEQYCLCPYPRYANMRNVYFIPTLPTLYDWLHKSGFKDINCMNQSITCIEEQRATLLSSGQSLVDALDPLDHRKTIEKYPAPKRAIIIAKL